MTGSTDGPTGSSGDGSKVQVSVLFVCLGNICRSTMAEGVFSHLIKQHPQWSEKIDWKIDSCGTGGWHIGEDPDDRTMSTLRKHGVNSYRHKGKWVDDPNLNTPSFDFIIGMDTSNLSYLRRHYASSNPMLFGQFASVPAKTASGEMEMASNPPIVDDPYYGADNGFETTFGQCKQYSENLVRYVFKDKFGEDVEISKGVFSPCSEAGSGGGRRRSARGRCVLSGENS